MLIPLAVMRRMKIDQMVMEMMEPLDKAKFDNASSKRSATVGEGIYPVCLKVADVEGSGKELEARGIKVLMRELTTPDASARWLIHPKEANGVMIETVKRS